MHVALRFLYGRLVLRAFHGRSIFVATWIGGSLAIEALNALSHMELRKDKDTVMKTFLNTTFGPAELAILEEALDHWSSQYGLRRQTMEIELAASVFINLFREGSDTVPALLEAASRHKALNDLARAAA